MLPDPEEERKTGVAQKRGIWEMLFDFLLKSSF